MMMELTTLREEKEHGGAVSAAQAGILAQLEATVKGLEALVRHATPLKSFLQIPPRGGICRKDLRGAGLGAGRAGRAAHSTRNKQGRAMFLRAWKESTCGASQEQPKAAGGLVAAEGGNIMKSTNPFDCWEAGPSCETNGSAPASQEYGECVLEASMESAPAEEHSATLYPDSRSVCYTLPTGHLHATPSSSHCNRIDAGRFNSTRERDRDGDVLYGRTETDIAKEARHVDLKQAKTTLALVELSPDCQSSQHSTGSFFSPGNFSAVPSLSDEGNGVGSKCAFLGTCRYLHCCTNSSVRYLT